MRCYLCSMDAKPQPNHRMYVEALRRMTPEQRLLKSFELTELTGELLRAGIRERFPEAGPGEAQRIHLERLARCRNRAF